jgi:hypothetical protein
LQIFGVSILQLVGFFRLQIVGFPMSKLLHFWDFNLQIVGLGLGFEFLGL